MGSKFHKNRRLPDIFAFDLDTFLLVSYTVVQNTWHFGLVRACAICMEDHISIFEPLLSNWFSIDLANCIWAWCPARGRRWLQAHQDQGLRATAGNNAGPLFPMSKRTSHHLVKCGLISFNVLPTATLAELDLLLLCLHKVFPKKGHALPHEIQCFVVDLGQDMDRAQRHIGYHQQQSHGLDLQ